MCVCLLWMHSLQQNNNACFLVRTEIHGKHRNIKSFSLTRSLQDLVIFSVLAQWKMLVDPVSFAEFQIQLVQYTFTTSGLPWGVTAAHGEILIPKAAIPGKVMDNQPSPSALTLSEGMEMIWRGNMAQKIKKSLPPSSSPDQPFKIQASCLCWFYRATTTHTLPIHLNQILPDVDLDPWIKKAPWEIMKKGRLKMEPIVFFLMTILYSEIYSLLAFTDVDE